MKSAAIATGPMERAKKMGRGHLAGRFLTGYLLCGSLVLAMAHSPALAAVAVKGETSRPHDSTFCLGEKAVVSWNVSGLKPGQEERLTVRITDEHDTEKATFTVPVTADAQGNWTGQSQVPAGANGFYRVFASLQDGTTLPSRFTRPKGFLTYAVVPDWQKRQDFGQDGSRFGMQGSVGPLARPAVRRMGVRWLLDGRSWFWKEPKAAGEFKAQTPEEIALKRAATQEPDGPWRTFRLYGIDGVPHWAGKPETRAGTSRTAELTPEGENAYAAYCREAALDIVRMYPDEPRRYYQPLWEPVAPWGYKGSDAGLVKIMKIAYEAIHAVDPRAVIVGPGGSSMDPAQIQWNERLLRAGMAKYVDAISTHPYVQPVAEKNGYVENLRAFRAMVKNVTGRPLEIMGTEQGYTTHEDVARELDQARGLVRQNIITIGEGFFCNYAFYTADFRLGRESGYGLYYNLDPKENSWNADYISPKPVVPAYSAMTLLLDGKTSNGPLDGLPAGVLGYAFQRGNEITAALWTVENAKQPCRLAVGNSTATVYDWMGRPVPVAPRNGALQLELGPEPVYVTGLAPALYGAPAQRRLRAQDAELGALPGASVLLRGNLAPAKPGQAVNATLQLSAAAALGALPAPKVAPNGKFETRLTIPPNTPPGKYRLQLTALENGLPAGLAGVELVVKPLVHLFQLEARQQGGNPEVTFRVRNDSGRALAVRFSGKLGAKGASASALAPAPAQPASLSLPAGGTAPVRLQWANQAIAAGRHYTLEVTAHDGDNLLASVTQNANFTSAAPMQRPPEVDGNLAEWESMPAIELNGRDSVIRSPQFYTGGVRGKLKFAWDQENLYFAAEVQSPSHIQPFTGEKLWRGDGIQLGINLTPGAGAAKTGNMAADQGSLEHSEFTFALTEQGPRTIRSISADPGRLPTGVVPEKDIRLAVVRRGQTTLYEASIPWAQLGSARKMAAGQSVGIAATINKIFSPTQPDPSALGMFGGIVDNKDPAEFGLLVLR